MIVRILGSAAGGGVPQWNCNCRNCAAARAGEQPRRTQSCAAVSADGRRWLLLNCSPDIALQIESFPPLQPHGTRDTPIDGMLLTDANVDHALGLAVLRQKGEHRFIIRSSGVVGGIAREQPALEPFTHAPHRWSAIDTGVPCPPLDDDDIVGHSLEVRAIAVPGTTPGYAGRQELPGAVYAYLIRQPGRDSLLYAPVFSSIDASLRAAIFEAGVAVLDGSFFTDDEMPSEGLMPKTARDLGHQPVRDTLAHLNGHRKRIIFTHINNSNPMLDPHSSASQAVRSTGAEVAYDDMQFEL